MPSADKDVEQGEHSHIAGGNPKWCSHWSGRRQFGDFLQNQTLNPIIMPFAIYPDHLKTYVQRKPAYRCFIHKCQNLEVTKMPFSEWMDKYTVVHPNNGILFKTKKKKKKKKKSCHAMKRHGQTLNEYY